MKMNLSKSKAYIAVALMATAFTTASCSKDEPVVAEKKAITILATVSNPESSATRAADIA